MADRPAGSRGSKGRAGQAGQGSSMLALGHRKGRVGDRRRLWVAPWEGLGAGGSWPGTARCRRRPSRCRTRCPRRTSGKPASFHVSSQSHESGPDTSQLNANGINESLIQIELGVAKERKTVRHVKAAFICCLHLCCVWLFVYSSKKLRELLLLILQ